LDLRLVEGVWMRVGLIRGWTGYDERMWMVTYKLLLFLFSLCGVRAKVFVGNVAVVETVCHVPLYLIAFEVYGGNYLVDCL
jgi:hypothetical protein